MDIARAIENRASSLVSRFLDIVPAGDTERSGQSLGAAGCTAGARNRREVSLEFIFGNRNDTQMLSPASTRANSSFTCASE
jgi:hypothetical protein